MSHLIHTISNSQGESTRAPNPSLGRPDDQTARSIQVSLMLKGMLGESAASAYLARQAVEPKIAQRVLSESGRRRSSDGVDGLEP